MADWEPQEDSVVGHGLWRQPSEAGGYRYLTDDCGCVRVFWEEAIDNPLLVFEVLDRNNALDLWLHLYYKRKQEHEDRKRASGTNPLV